MSLKLVEEIILGSNQSSVTFSNIPQDGKSLLFRIDARCTDTATNGTFTSVTTNNLIDVRSKISFFDNGFSASTDDDYSLAYVAKVSNADNTSNLFSNFIFEINDYTSSGRHRYLSHGGFQDDVNYSVGFSTGGDLRTSAAINTITFNTTGNFVTNSAFSIYTLGE